MAEEIKDGQVFEVEYPFVRTTYEQWDVDGPTEVTSWRPGCEYVNRYYGENAWTEAVADGVGRQILTVVATFKPGKYPARVFYTVRWVPPNGEPFGKTKLRIATTEKFRRLTRGFMAHESDFEWRLRSDEERAA